MNNKQIAYAFDDLANLMELHEEDDFRIRSYRNAYLNLRKLDQPLLGLSDAELKNIKGVGPAIAAKIRELLESGKMATLEKYREKTPPGVVEMLEVNGFGPKKVRSVWKDMGIESIGELWYACNENRLIEFKGFGLKTQEDLKQKLDYFLKSRHKLHLDTALQVAENAASFLRDHLPDTAVDIVGEVRRCCPVVESVALLVSANELPERLFSSEKLMLSSQKDDVTEAIWEGESKIFMYTCKPERRGNTCFRHNASPAFLDRFLQCYPNGLDSPFASEEAIFEALGLASIPPEFRENGDFDFQQKGSYKLVNDSDIPGVLHVHTTWSDGLHTLHDMCLHARDLGYAYIGITDHSQSAFYANGLKPERVLAQMAEIDALNAALAPFKIFKGIESDILNDGSLDYDDALLAKFDFVIASVHSNLKMTQEKATERILRAIQNPYTTILGHPTGRLLLSREGYPLDWHVILDACAQYGVAIELNANPHRLDIDYALIPEALKRGIKIAINPDAHSKNGISDIRYGVMAARKGGVQKDNLFVMG